MKINIIANILGNEVLLKLISIISGIIIIFGAVTTIILRILPKIKLLKIKPKKSNGVITSITVFLKNKTIETIRIHEILLIKAKENKSGVHILNSTKGYTILPKDKVDISTGYNPPSHPLSIELTEIFKAFKENKLNLIIKYDKGRKLLYKNRQIKRKLEYQ